MKKGRYLKHDVSASANRKLMLLMQEEGARGYGLYWLLIETLCCQPRMSAPLALLSSLAYRFRTKVGVLNRIVTCYDLFVVDGETFHSLGLDKRMRALVAAQEAYDSPMLGLQKRGKILEDSIEDAHSARIEEKRRKENNNSRERGVASVAVVIEPDTSSQTVAPPAIRPICPWEELVDQMAACQEWMDLTGLHSQLGELYVAHRPQVVELFKNHIRRRDKGGQLLTLHDVKEYFANCLTPGTWTCQAMREQLLLHHNRCLQAQQGSLYETLVEGKRTYLGRPIPDDAPPRPDPYSVWDEETKLWRR